MSLSIWWLRRDLRLRDNLALTAALNAGDAVLPVFIIDPALQASPYYSERRWAFLLGGLAALDADLRQRGSRLLVREGRPANVLAALLAETGAAGIYAEADVSPYARQRDDALAASLPLHLTPGVSLHPPGSIRKKDGGVYTVYSPYARAWHAQPLPTPLDIIPAPERINTPAGITGISLPATPRTPTDSPFQPGEAAAQMRLSAFVDGPDAPVFAYKTLRDRPDLDATSGLSPYLRFGMLSIREAVVAALEAHERAADKDARKGIDHWLSELIWREFYIDILFNFPVVRRAAFRAELRRIPWRNDEAEFRAWTEGRTGYPIVDASMRYLREVGWLHNRARMIVASFLVKDLMIDWRWGERWFMQQLIDGDPASNNGGWQWTAGTGTDAAPYFRIFNPVLQGEKFDPDGVFVRQWVPELASVPDKYLHKPWSMPLAVQRELDCVIGSDYPAPIVDHKFARERTLAAYNGARAAHALPPYEER